MKQHIPFYSCAGLLLALLVLAYSSHFDNGFYFDDSHTIVNNANIQQLSNIGSFFRDASTTSTLPANQVYRPGYTTLNAIDYWLGGGLNPLVFHGSIFTSYLLLCALLYLLFLRVFAAFSMHKMHRYTVLLAVGWYALHTANAETINYISARTDSFSTLMLVLALVIYIYSEIGRRTFLYLLPVAIGFMVKEPTIMFAPLLFLYDFLFVRLPNAEREQAAVSANQIYLSAAMQSFRVALPALLLSVLLFALWKNMTPEHWVSFSNSRFDYFITQPFVILHYFNNFVLPVNLSADTDWQVLASWKDDRLFAGLGFLSLLIALALWSLKRTDTRGITFGIAWFLLALLPTSSVFPLDEVLNDHRTFFPYIGLIIAASTGIFLVYAKWENLAIVKVMFTLGVIALLLAHAAGTHARSQVWDNAQSLWADVVQKSPKNGRGLMNYGVALMHSGDYVNALDNFEKALLLQPNYSFLQVNLGIVHGALGDAVRAERYFKHAQQLNSLSPISYSHFASWLKQQGRLREALQQVDAALALSPKQHAANQLRQQILAQLAELAASETPQPLHDQQSADTYLNLSLLYYNKSQFEKSIEAASRALQINAGSAPAWNNVCAAHTALGQYTQAIAACQQGLALDSTMLLLKNNLLKAVRLQASTP